MPSALDGLSQAIHDDRAQFAKRYLLTSHFTYGAWELHLFTSILDVGVMGWTTNIPEDLIPANPSVLAEAIKRGYLVVDPSPTRGESRVANNITLRFLPPEEEPMSVDLEDPSDLSYYGETLFKAALKLQARRMGGTDTCEPSSWSRGVMKLRETAEVRSLRAQLSEKDIEITGLHAKLASMKATVARSTGSDKKKLVSPQKKAPANASALQPNAKRRKVVEDEFAGSSNEEDE